jgi:transposase
MTRKKTERKVPYRDKWRISDDLWAKIAPLVPLPTSKPHPLGCHRQRVDHRKAMDAIFFVLRTGCQWNALNATGICSSSTAHLRYQEWTAAGVFQKLWALGLKEYDELKGIDWAWQSMDGAMTKAPLGGGKNRSQPHGSGQRRRQAQPVDGGERGADRAGR